MNTLANVALKDGAYARVDRVPPANEPPAGPEGAWANLITKPSRRAALAGMWRTARLIHANASGHRLAKPARFMFRALRHFSAWRQWHGFLAFSSFAGIGRHYPHLLEKPLRPYLHRDADPVGCLGILREHYLFLQQHAPAALVEAMLRDEPFVLSRHDCDEIGEPLVIGLTYSKHMQQEGELTLAIGRTASARTRTQHEWIAALTFVIRYGVSGWEILLGGVQGAGTENSRRDIKPATRLFQGLRPKHLLVHVLRELAGAWGINGIYAVDDISHCFTLQRYRDRLARMKSSYAEFWLEMGGQAVAGGFYSLPAKNLRRPIQTVPSRKRAQYLRRFALLDALNREIVTKLSREPSAV